MSDDAPQGTPDKDTPDREAAGGDGFDLGRIKRLVKMMDEYGLKEVKLSKAGETWELSRGGEAYVPPPAAPAPAAQPAAPSPVTPPPAAAPAADAAPAGNVITSPTVGTFYSKPNPEDPHFVNPGDTVAPDTIVCLIEAMKVFNQIPAETSGVVKRALVTDGDAVEFGQPLFELE